MNTEESETTEDASPDTRDSGFHPVNEDSDTNRALADFLYRLADRSYEMEMRRGRELSDLSAQLLSSITIMSVALLTPASFLFECYSNNTGALSCQQVRLAWMYAIVLLLQAAALVIVLRARSLKPMSALASPGDQSRYVLGVYERRSWKAECPPELYSAMRYSDGLNENFKGTVKKHDAMWTQLQRAMCLMKLSCLLSAGFGILLLLELC